MNIILFKYITMGLFIFSCLKTTRFAIYEYIGYIYFKFKILW